MGILYPRLYSAYYNRIWYDPLGAALTNPTETAHYYYQKTQGQQGTPNHYPVSFRDNPYREAITLEHPDASYYRVEKYFKSKPAGEPFVSAEDAYKFFAKGLTDSNEKDALMAEIITAKLTQYPELLQQIQERGGVDWLLSCEHRTKANNPNWEGRGQESAFIRTLIRGHQQAMSQELNQMPQKTQMKLTINCDGACKGNPGPGGWGYSITNYEKTLTEGYGGEDKTTNNRMELIAAIEGISAAVAINPEAKLILRSDSQYVINTLTKGWNRKANHDLWQKLDSALFGVDVDYEWVKGHSGDQGNERADELSNLGVDSLRNKTPPLKAHPEHEKITTTPEQEFNQTDKISQSQEKTENKDYNGSEADGVEIPKKTDSLIADEPSQQTSDSLLNLLPLSAEYMPENLVIQQQRTEQIAPILAAFLKAKQSQNPAILEHDSQKQEVRLTGNDNILTWNGKELKLIDKATEQVKMRASAQGSNGEITWIALPLPPNSLGLSEQDVENYTKPQFVSTIRPLHNTIKFKKNK